MCQGDLGDRPFRELELKKIAESVIMEGETIIMKERRDGGSESALLALVPEQDMQILCWLNCFFMSPEFRPPRELE